MPLALTLLSFLLFYCCGWVFSPKASSAYFKLLIGLYLTHVLFLFTVPLTWILLFLCSLVVFVAYKTLRSTNNKKNDFKISDKTTWLIFLVILSPFFWMNASEGISHWDARSIWFFHAKIFYHSNQLDLNTLSLPSVKFSHPYYPTLLPFISALLAKGQGFWNEYGPKISLSFFHVLFYLGLRQCVKLSSKQQLLIFGLSSLYLGGWMWNGYMDGYLAIFTLLSFFFLKEKQFSHFLATALLLPQIKDEGIILAVFLLCLFLIQEKNDLRLHIKQRWKLAAFVVLPTILWKCLKTYAGLKSYLALNSESLQRLKERSLSSTDSLDIFRNLYLSEQFIFCVAFIIACSLVYKNIWMEIQKNNFKIYIFCFFYISIFAFVFLTTPMTLMWHISTSVHRLLLPVYTLLIGSTLYTICHSQNSKT